MKNYWATSCKDQLAILKKEMDELFLALEEDANEKNINAYREKRQEYLFAKKQYENIEKALSE